jgi:hypothetical protein
MAFGLTPQGFVPKQQQDILTEIQDSLQLALGTNINLLPQAILGQIMNVYAEREALLWQEAEAVYVSQRPSSAEGTSVDNILALNNLRRLKATSTKTAPTNTQGTPGLQLLGTPGTLIPKDSIISMAGYPTIQFTTDADITIATAVSAVQYLWVYGGNPTQGAITLSIKDPAGNTLQLPSLPFNALNYGTRVTWPIGPTLGNVIFGVNGILTTPLAYTASNAAITAAIQAAGFPNAGVTGDFTTGLLIQWDSFFPLAPAPVLTANATKLAFSANPTAGTLQISLNGNNAAPVAFNATSAQLQTALQAITGFERVTVSGTATSAVGFYIDWGWVAPATVAVVVQPTGATVTVVQTNTLNEATTVINSIQAAINTLYDLVANNYPYTDVQVGGSFTSSPVIVNFGARAPLLGQPTSGGQPQNLFEVVVSTLQNGITVCNLNPTNFIAGSVARGVGTATCTQTGPVAVPATFLSVIGSPISGWTSVSNPLDCILGTNAEDDTEALTRRSALLAANANGPAQAIAEKVAKIPNVVQAIPFQNLSLAAEQIVTFNAVPTAGTFSLSFYGPSGVLQIASGIAWNALASVQQILFTAVPSSGDFTITFGALTTASIPYNGTYADVQNAVRALGGNYANAIVTGNFTLGFTLAFGSLPQLPLSVTNSLIGSVPTAVPSVQAVINALASYSQVLVVGSYAAGLNISFNGSAGGQPQLLAVASNSLTSVSTITVAYGRPGKSFEIVVNDNNGAVSDSAIAQTIFDSGPAGILAYGTTIVPVADSYGNTVNIGFSRPAQVPIYVVIALQTDLTTAAKPKFSPGSVLTIQSNIVAIGSAFIIGGIIIGQGSGGLIGAFNDVPGITSYTLTFGTAPNPVNSANIQLLAEQVALFETFNVIVSYV